MIFQRSLIWFVTKNIELKKGKAKRGDAAVFLCGRNILRKKIIRRVEGNLIDVLRKDKYKSIIPSANTLQEAINYIKKLYGTTEGIFTVYCFK